MPNKATPDYHERLATEGPYIKTPRERHDDQLRGAEPHGPMNPGYVSPGAEVRAERVTEIHRNNDQGAGRCLTRVAVRLLVLADEAANDGDALTAAELFIASAEVMERLHHVGEKAAERGNELLVDVAA